MLRNRNLRSVSAARRQKAASGFTLIELLVVVAIIALLISILLPSLGRAREKAKTTVCLSNIRQIGMGYRMYCDSENNGKAYTASTGIPGAFWFFVAQPYLGDNKKSYICPKTIEPSVSSVDDPTHGPMWGTASNIWDGTSNNGRWIKWIDINATPVTPSSSNPAGLVGRLVSDNSPHDAKDGNKTNYLVGYKSSYGINSWADGHNNVSTSVDPMADRGGLHTLSNIQRQDTVIFSDATFAKNDAGTAPPDRAPGTPSEIGTGSGGIYPGLYDSSADLSGGRTRDALSRVLLDRHDMAINCSFADGSAATVKLTDIWHVAWYNGWRDVDMPASVISTLKNNHVQ